MMPCDTAFRVVAGRHLAELTVNHGATCRGDPTALHQMRMALTRLRAAISFFAPMVDDSKRTQIRSELKWLNTRLGAVRDLDVTIERLKETSGKQWLRAKLYRSWAEQRAESLRQLARALRSVRYRRLVTQTSDWIENGPWSTAKGKQAEERACPIAAYSLHRLSCWQNELLKKSRKLPTLGRKKRHRLRLTNKKLCYSIEALGDLSADKGFSSYHRALKHLRKAQKSLGHLNDDARGRSLAASLERDGFGPPLRLPDLKNEKRLLRTAVAAYRKLAALKPFRI